MRFIYEIQQDTAGIQVHHIDIDAVCAAVSYVIIYVCFMSFMLLNFGPLKIYDLVFPSVFSRRHPILLTETFRKIALRRKTEIFGNRPDHVYPPLFIQKGHIINHVFFHENDGQTAVLALFIKFLEQTSCVARVCSAQRVRRAVALDILFIPSV